MRRILEYAMYFMYFGLGFVVSWVVLTILRNRKERKRDEFVAKLLKIGEDSRPKL